MHFLFIFDKYNNGDNMNILITGAASGIGYNVGMNFAKKGYNVFFSVETDKQLEVLREKLENDKLHIGSFKLDVKDKEDREKLKNMDIDILVSNAAIGIGGSILEADMNDVRENYEVNVFSNFEVVQIVLNNMLNKNSGKIVIMSSMIANIPIPFLGIYASTKASISMLGNCLRKEIKLINNNVDIILIEPGIYKTGFNKVMLDSKYDNTNSRFKELNNSIMVLENEILNFVGCKDLSSISKKIVKASLSNNPKSIYRAPLLQNILIKLYIKFIKK